MIFDVKMIVEQTRTGFSAYSPDVDGCVATGATREQTKQNFLGALQFHFAEDAEDLAMVKARQNEPTITHEALVTELQANGYLP